MAFGVCSSAGVNASVSLKTLLACAVSHGLLSVRSSVEVPSVSSVACGKFLRALFRGGIFRGLFNEKFFRGHGQGAFSVGFFAEVFSMTSFVSTF